METELMTHYTNCSVSPTIILGGRPALSVSHTAEFRPGSHTHTQTYAHTQVSTLPLVFVNIKPQNDYLNMTSACLCVNV